MFSVDLDKLSTLADADRTIADIEREVVRKALETHAGHVTNAAKALGCSRPTLYRLLKKHFAENERLFLAGRIRKA